MAGKMFWYKLIDLMHYSQLNLTSPRRGFMVWNKHDWALCFYKGDQDRLNAAYRAWERFKADARKERLFVALPGDSAERASARPSSMMTHVNNRVVICVKPTQDALYAALGPPHMGGLRAQVRCERERRESLLPLIVLGIAAAARVEQQRLKVG